jgi:hypothetical protein
MGNTWRYAQATRTHALETGLACDEDMLWDLVRWLDAAKPQRIYQCLLDYQDEGIRWLGGPDSRRKKRFKSAEEQRQIVCSAMWHGKIAYSILRGPDGAIYYA